MRALTDMTRLSNLQLRTLGSGWPLIARLQLLAEDSAQRGLGVVIDEGVIRAVHDADVALAGHALERAACLHPEQIQSGSPAREQEHHAYTAAGDILHLPAEVVRQA